jgi:pyridoxamine 5'-phosphate oxidase family protein
MSAFTDAEIAYLQTQLLGRLATAQGDGTLQASPVSFYHNPVLDTIDIGGHNMAASQKFRNVAHNARAALVVDDIISVQPWQVRCLEIRGRAKRLPNPRTLLPGRQVRSSESIPRESSAGESTRLISAAASAS